MERSKRPYSVQKRPTRQKNRFMYYVKFRDSETGEYLSAVSSGCSSKSAASNWADKQIKDGKVTSFAHGRLTFEKLAQDFWDYEKSTYIQGKLARGDSISRGYASISGGYCKKYLIPEFGQRHLDALKPIDFEQFILKLSQVYILSSASVNRVYTCLRVMLREAIRLGYLERDPTERVALLREMSAEKGILTMQEVTTLFDKNALITLWDGDALAMTANALAAATGMRLGEVRGLTLGCVHTDYLEVLHSWEEQHGLKEPKRGSIRIVPITDSLYKAIKAIADMKKLSEPDDLIFCGENQKVPVSKWSLPHKLEVALSKMGIDEKAQETRNITFHSWRHFFNSMLRGKLPDEKLRLMTGHKSEEMTERYSHALPEDLMKVRDLQAKILIA